MQLKKTCLAAIAAVALAACGGGDDGPTYSRLVSFGDSLSDVGSYKTRGLLAISDNKGGKYTVNGTGNEIWIEQLSIQLGLPAPCAAQTGLEASGAFVALFAEPTPHPGCTAYGQGGSRVSDPIGPWNKNSPNKEQAQLGQLTVPVERQIANHLDASGGRFADRELVTVLAGANDVFVKTDELAAIGMAAAQAAAQGGATPEQIAAATQMAVQNAAPTIIPTLGQAGAALAALIKTQIVAKGAKRVVVMNLPNISMTPATVKAEKDMPGSQLLVNLMTTTFNDALKAGLQLETTPEVALVDFYAENTKHFGPTALSTYGLTNTDTPACTNKFDGADNFLAPSLTCTTSTTIPGKDVSHYLFADTVHPTPYGHSLIRDMVLTALKAKNWL